MASSSKRLFNIRAYRDHKFAGMLTSEGCLASVGLESPRPKTRVHQEMKLLGFFPFTYLTMARHRVKRESFSEMTNVDQAGHEGGNLAFRVRFRQNRLDLRGFFPANLHGPKEIEASLSVQMRTEVVRKRT